MRISTELGGAEDLRKSGMEIGKEAASHAAVVSYTVACQCQGERRDEFFEGRCGAFHGRLEEPKRVRFWMARAYSRQMSCGASWTYIMVVWMCE